MSDEYNGEDDFSKSINAAYEAIHARVASGGKPWRPKLISLRLPIPPSVNSLYFNRGKSGGRGKTSNYRKWIKEADAWYYEQKLHTVKPITGPCELRITLPRINGDPSNRIKACEDWLVSRKLTGDDKNNHRVSIEIDDSTPQGECWIEVRAA